MHVDLQIGIATGIRMAEYLEAYMSSYVNGRTRAEHDAALAARMC